MYTQNVKKVLKYRNRTHIFFCKQRLFFLSKYVFTGLIFLIYKTWLHVDMFSFRSACINPTCRNLDTSPMQYTCIWNGRFQFLPAMRSIFHHNHLLRKYLYFKHNLSFCWHKKFEFKKIPTLRLQWKICSFSPTLKIFGKIPSKMEFSLRLASLVHTLIINWIKYIVKR